MPSSGPDPLRDQLAQAVKDAVDATVVREGSTANCCIPLRQWSNLINGVRALLAEEDDLVERVRGEEQERIRQAIEAIQVYYDPQFHQPWIDPRAVLGVIKGDGP